MRYRAKLLFQYLKPITAIKMESVKKVKRERIFLFDLLRGISIVLIMIDHFFYDLCLVYGESFKSNIFINLYEFSIDYYDGLYRLIYRPIMLFVLFFISGILTDFSRNNLKRTCRYGAVALLIFAVTFIFSIITKSENTVITIGVMYAFTVCAFFGWITQKLKTPNFVLIFFGILLSMIGLLYFFGATDYLTDKLFFLLFNIDEGIKYTADYFPLLPFLGYFLLGIAVSRTYYQEKKEHVKLPVAVKKVLSPLSFIGRTSLWWYVLSQGVFIVFFEICLMLGW